MSSSYFSNRMGFFRQLRTFGYRILLKLPFRTFSGKYIFNLIPKDKVFSIRKNLQKTIFLINKKLFNLV